MLFDILFFLAFTMTLLSTFIYLCNSNEYLLWNLTWFNQNIRCLKIFLMASNGFSSLCIFYNNSFYNFIQSRKSLYPWHSISILTLKNGVVNVLKSTSFLSVMHYSCLSEPQRKNSKQSESKIGKCTIAIWQSTILFVLR